MKEPTCEVCKCHDGCEIGRDAKYCFAFDVGPVWPVWWKPWQWLGWGLNED